ncbi:MAG: hypothetical protein A3I24_01610 [Candidatus Harrisonbacteria bacterium RIFCSPLOWO2_02_FULL_41_13b]|uniref:Uncharacterized protein n=1 Tax=Candidatus Harrisonbacteria bacterium RIFCSPLOWO2_02_FULL_41_13b TaxID=1798409 RepID=A0A1G1ZS63_9BACT|nr:MAG: hypothetical protein A3I24_01610 [Candidatus Harrisonbacteria bacterium RIFCSPLOWO2_02_FULL_41_13b]
MAECNRLVGFLDKIWGLILILASGVVILFLLALSAGLAIVWFFIVFIAITTWLPILLAKLLGML